MKHIKTTSRVAPAVSSDLVNEIYCKVVDLSGAPDILGKCGNNEAA